MKDKVLALAKLIECRPSTCWEVLMNLSLMKESEQILQW